MKDRMTPIARCPQCDRAILFSSDPRRKTSVTVRVAQEGESGDMIMCSKCHVMLVKESRETAFIKIPILGYVL